MDKYRDSVEKANQRQVNSYIQNLIHMFVNYQQTLMSERWLQSHAKSYLNTGIRTEMISWHKQTENSTQTYKFGKHYGLCGSYYT